MTPRNLALLSALPLVTLDRPDQLNAFTPLMANVKFTCSIVEPCPDSITFRTRLCCFSSATCRDTALSQIWSGTCSE